MLNSYTFFLATFVWSQVVPVTAFWRLLCDNPLTVGRYDPIVSPGAIAGHVHTISGKLLSGVRMFPELILFVRRLWLRHVNNL